MSESATLFMSRVVLKPGASTQTDFWAQTRDDPLGHHTVWSWFPEKQHPRSFLYRQQGLGTKAEFLVLSEQRPVDEVGLWEIDSKVFAPKLRAGELLGFSVRVNPTLRRARRPGDGEEDDRYLGRRIDVFMDAKKRRESNGQPISDQGELLTESCSAWLAKRGLRTGFEVVDERCRADAYRRHRIRRRKKRAAPITFASVDLSGILRITDVEQFLVAVRKGLGPEKAFGCGLMLIRRI